MDNVLLLKNQLCFPLYAASRLTTKAYKPFLKKLNITYPQYLVLIVLWEHKQLTVSEIGKHLMLESNTLTPLLKRLEEKKLITRKQSNTDERVIDISLTKNGENLKLKAANIPKQIIGSMMDEKQPLNLEQIENLKKKLNILIETLRGNSN